jgi:hypothetical protein
MKAVLIISERDNVATALERLDPGRRIEVETMTLIAIEPIAAGHKIALRPIAAGDAVFKYGSPIGLAIIDIPAGAHVHTHNVASSRGRGDLKVAAPHSGPHPRPAEPPDTLQTSRPE